MTVFMAIRSIELIQALIKVKDTVTIIPRGEITVINYFPKLLGSFIDFMTFYEGIIAVQV